MARRRLLGHWRRFQALNGRSFTTSVGPGASSPMLTTSRWGPAASLSSTPRTGVVASKSRSRCCVRTGISGDNSRGRCRGGDRRLPGDARPTWATRCPGALLRPRRDSRWVGSRCHGLLDLEHRRDVAVTTPGAGRGDATKDLPGTRPLIAVCNLHVDDASFAPWDCALSALRIRPGTGDAEATAVSFQEEGAVVRRQGQGTDRACHCRLLALRADCLHRGDADDQWRDHRDRDPRCGTRAGRQASEGSEATQPGVVDDAVTGRPSVASTADGTTET